MKELRAATRFRRDVKRAARQGRGLQRLEDVLAALVRGGTPARRYRPNHLKGVWSGFWECHIEPDWLPIRDDRPDAIVQVRRGTPADLFE